MRSVELRILCDVQAIEEHRGPLPLTPTLKLLLGVLLSEPEKTIDKTRLLDLPERGWQVNTRDKAIGDLRAFLQHNFPGQANLISTAGSLRLDLADPEILDYHRFQRLVEQARSADDENAVRLFSAALGEFRGMPFAGLKAPLIDRIRLRIDAQHRQACFDRAERRFRLRQHVEVLDEVLEQLKAWPDDERLIKILVRALVAVGRRSDATKVFTEFDEANDATAELRRDVLQILESSRTATESTLTRPEVNGAGPKDADETADLAPDKRLRLRELVLVWGIVLVALVLAISLLVSELPSSTAPDNRRPDSSSSPPSGPPMVLVYQSGDEPGVGAGRDGGQDHTWIMGIDDKDYLETVYRTSYPDEPIDRIEGAFEVEMNPQSPCPPVARVVWTLFADGVEKAKGSLHFPASGEKFRADLDASPRDLRVRLRVDSPVPFDTATPCYAMQVTLRGVTVVAQGSK